MAQCIRRWSTEPEIVGSIPSGVRLPIFQNILQAMRSENDMVLIEDFIRGKPSHIRDEIFM